MKGYRLQIKINYINKLIILIKDCNFQVKMKGCKLQHLNYY